MDENGWNQEGKQSESDDIVSQQSNMNTEYEVDRELEIDDEKQKLNLERRRLQEERRQIELEKEKLKDLKPVRRQSGSNTPCVVCGETKNTAMHYQAMTCEGCKIFFRRNSKKHASLKCTNLDSQGKCDVLSNRRFCASCRFQKCLDAGMNMGRIWDTDRLKSRKLSSQRLERAPEQEPQPTSSTAAADGTCSVGQVVSPNFGAHFIPDAGAGASRPTSAIPSAGTSAVGAGVFASTGASGGAFASVGAPAGASAGAGTFASATAGAGAFASACAPAGASGDAGAGAFASAGAPAGASGGAGAFASVSAPAGAGAFASAAAGATVGGFATAEASAGASTGAGGSAGPSAGAGAASPQSWALSQGFTDDHKLLIDSISCAFQRSLRIEFDQSTLNFTDARKTHQMKKCSAQGRTTASQQSARQPAQTIATDSSTPSSPSMPNPFSAFMSGMDFETQSSDVGRVAQMDLPLNSDMATGESAATSVPMDTKAAKKEDTPIDLSVPESVGATAASASGGGGWPGGGSSPLNSGFEFDPDMSKMQLEMVVHNLKQMIVFVKALPVYQKLPMTEQVTFVKETFADYIQIKAAQAYNPETNSFCTPTDPPEEVFVSDICLGGAATFLFNHGLPYCINHAKLKFTKEEDYLFCALCILNPDRPSFSDVIKQTVAPHYTGLVEVLCASGRINHADQPLWFSQMMSQMAETRKLSDMFKDMMMQLQLQGTMLPILGEILEI